MSSSPSSSASSSSRTQKSTTTSDMAVRAQLLAANFHAVVSRINSISRPQSSSTSSTSTSSQKVPVRVVAVSKLKPASDILALHQATGHAHFGENYSQELLEKASALPQTIAWHFIGQLQTNKCKSLAERVPNLWAVESVDAKKKADALDKGRANLSRTMAEARDKLRVYVQVNTSGEESKSGCDPNDAPTLAKHIVDNCTNLKLQGLMTIGAIARSRAPDVPNQDFLLLKKVRDEVAKEVGVEAEGLELSMGMSQDFEGAVELGSSNVRVGTTIFGERPPKKDVATKDQVAVPKP